MWRAGLAWASISASNRPFARRCALEDRFLVGLAHGATGFDRVGPVAQEPASLAGKLPGPALYS